MNEGGIPKVVVASPNPQHSYRLAVALQKAGMLDKYYTGMYTSWETPPLNLLGWLPGSVRTRMEEHFFGKFKRSDAELDTRRVRTVGVWSNLLMALSFRLGVKSPWHRRGFSQEIERFQRTAVAEIKDSADILVLYDTKAYFGFLAAQESPLIKVLDMASTHLATRTEIYQEAARRWPEYVGNVETFATRPQRFAEIVEEPDLADFLLVGSNWVKLTCVANGIAPEKIYVVHYGVDTDLFRPIARAERDAVERPFRIIYVGNASAAKGFPIFLQMLEGLKDLNIEVVCCGAEKADISQYDLGRIRLSFLGYLPRSELAVQMQRSDMLCHPSLLEGFSLTCLEAMSSGLPVLTNPRSGTAEIIEQGENGFVVGVGDVTAMKKVVKLLINDPELRCLIGKGARETAEQYSWSTYEKNIAAVFDDIARRGKWANVRSYEKP